ncbi:MAG: GNAT family N-acetyltransferase [Solirubrobacterales bacterium]|nr:GNAT family N-acetyltransferase [Solirubrobacterales bacterium]MCB8915414.1 GNAT family N-acetyltransferase [Thermoleophilales bacterium]
MDDDPTRRDEEEEETGGRRDPEDLDAGLISLRPVSEDHVGELRWIHARAEITRWWDEPGIDFPWDEPESTRLAILVDGQVGGMIQYWEEDDPKYRHAGIDLFVDPALHNRGIGTRAVREVARYLFEARGHHRLEIDPAADNAAAIRVYEKVGFKPVGLTRRSERDPDGRGWHDSLLMDMLATEFIHGDED